jgi:hypothetical protein
MLAFQQIRKRLCLTNTVVPTVFWLRADKNTHNLPNNGFILCLLYKEVIKISNSRDMEKSFHLEIGFDFENRRGIKSRKELNMQVTYRVTLYLCTAQQYCTYAVRLSMTSPVSLCRPFCVIHCATLRNV